MKKNRIIQSVCGAALAGLAMALVGCGTTSELKSAQPGSLTGIQRYTDVSVADFGDQTPKKAKAGDTNSGPLAEKMREQGRHFADLIALEVDRTKAFQKVSRDAKPLPGSLLISGDITRCTEGSASLRLWIGLGAGSSYFDATVRFSDADSGQPVGQVLVDKNSWGLGGGLAAGQTVQSFMQSAAEKIADRLAKAKHSTGTSK